MNPQEVLDFAQKNEARQLDLRFTDIPSLQHHVSYPMSELGLGSFEDGFGMDGSSIRGWAAIHESDMLLIPDPSTVHLHGPVCRNTDAGDVRRRDRSHYEAALRTGPAVDRQEGRAISGRTKLAVGDTAYFVRQKPSFRHFRATYVSIRNLQHSGFLFHRR